MTAALPVGRSTRMRDAVRAHAAYAVGVLVFIILLAWLTSEEGAVDIAMLVHVALFGVLYRLALHPALERRFRENLQFLVLVAGLLGLLAFLTDGRMAAMMPIYTTILIYAVFALGLNLQFGFTGIINFGHVAFMGLGAYATALFSIKWLEHAPALERPGASLVAVLIAAVLVGIVFGVLASVAVEEVRARRGARFPGRGLHSIAGGAAGLAAGILVVFLLVPLPLTPMWAAAFLIGAASVVGMALAAVAGVLLGLPALRLRSDYLAIVTIGAAEIFRRALRNEAWLTRGHAGLPRLPRPFQAAGDEWVWLQALAHAMDVTPTVMLLFLMSLTALLLVLAAFWILLRSPYGRVLRAIREDEEVPRALGKNVFRFKLQVFALGGAVAAIAGSLLAWESRYISPEHFIPLITFWAWIIVVIGGAGSNKGTVLGALILWAFFYGTQFLDLDSNLGLSSAQGSALRIVVIGVLLIVLMLFKPEGILGRREEMVLGR